MLRRFCICLSLLIIGFHANADQPQKTEKPAVQNDQLVSKTLLKHCGMDVAWQQRVYIKDNEKIDRMLIQDKHLFIITDQNYLYCIDRSNGKIAFSLIIAAKGLPIHGPGFYQNEMFFLVGSQLKIVDLEIGRITKTVKYTLMGKGAVCKPVRNEKFIYISGSNQRLFAMNVEGGTQAFEAASDDSSTINSVIADDDHLVFSTKSGYVARIKNDKQKGIWRFEVGGIGAPIVRDGEWLYVSGLDRKLYKLNIENGESGWLSGVLIGEALKDSARIGKKTLYQYAGVKGLFAVDKESGKKLWQMTDCVDLLCEKGSTSYTLAKPSRLVVVNNDEGKKMYSVNFAGVSVHAVNTEDSLIYVGCEKGRIMCIKPDKQ